MSKFVRAECDNVLSLPTSIRDIADTEAYTLDSLGAKLSNQQLLITIVGETVVKLPSRYGWKLYRGAFQRYRNEGLARFVRSLEKIERVDNFSELLALFPDFGRVEELYGRELAHYLLIHRLQYDRVRARFGLTVPDTRFVILWRRRFLRRPKAFPALIQERIAGPTLWDIFDHERSEIRYGWRDKSELIAQSFEPFMPDTVSAHIDFNIKNFVLCADNTGLCYVDTKPTVCLVDERNEQNRAGIRMVFM